MSAARPPEGARTAGEAEGFPMYAAARTGDAVADIDTPALVLDLDAMERNIARMAAFARQHGVRWRPHAKMHKCAVLALRLVAAGAVGACVQKTAEAEALAAAGVQDLYISNEVVAPAKLARVALLARSLQQRGGRLAIAVDSPEGVDRLAAALAGAQDAIDVFVEIDVGQGRCGLPPGPEAVQLARRIGAAPQLRFAGLQAYHGKAQHLRSAEDRRAAMAAVLLLVRDQLDAFAEAGLAVPLVTGAGTGSMAHEAGSGIYGELQAGSFLFMDADYAGNDTDPAQPVFEHALFVKSQVISRNARHAVCDAGHKSHAIDSGLPLVHRPEGGAPWRYANGGDEHGVLHADDGQPLPALGQAVWLIPGHCDPTVNLHDTLVGVRGGLLQGRVEELLRVDARGALA
ncbi:D-serine deaminase-like pyridoxal phosphate-dependent protein [Pseudorhodoferax soli]|uniref:D-serine deaminase-like pyridoxal phosphate-dependent protein n=2 Tax=Pseudorhodoferax soli TaxID=545864 RepID=A0A368XK72_9BURK|nr:D-serine deaminase-like pyridoxal phosphate-dependent protein [Pseudorhodoferax soli]